MTTSKNGWAWVLGAVGLPTRTHTEFDGAYLAACPGCGKDTWWNAFDGEPMCDCSDEDEVSCSCGGPA